MQRRAAAIYVALFIVIGAASYSLIATAQTPEVEFSNPDYELSQGDEFEAGGQTYNVSSIEASEQGGDHGAATTVIEGEIQPVDQSEEDAIAVENNANVTLGEETYLAHFPDESTLQLTQNFEQYNRQTAEIDRFHTYENGLWGVSIASFLTAVFMVGFAYLPSRY